MEQYAFAITTNQIWA